MSIPRGAIRITIWFTKDGRTAGIQYRPAMPELPTLQGLGLGKAEADLLKRYTKAYARRKGK